MKYVYTHSINGTVFYVGSGTKYRTSSKNGRNRLWNAKVKNNNGLFDVNIISTELNDYKAQQIEKDFIKKLKPECNINGKFGRWNGVVCFNVEEKIINQLLSKFNRRDLYKQIRSILKRTQSYAVANVLGNATSKAISKKIIKIRVTNKEKKIVARKALANKMSVNVYCRNLVIPKLLSD